MKTESYSSDVTTRVSAQVDLIQVEANLWLYCQKIKSEVLSKGKRGQPLLVSDALSPDRVVYGITNDAGRRNLLKGKPVATPKRPLTAVKKGALEAMRMQGHDVVCEYLMSPKDAFEAATVNNLAPDDLVVIEWDSGMAYDRAGRILPVAVSFSYYDTDIDESHYDLPELIKILSKRTDVKLGNPKALPPGLFEIPYYNAHRGHTQSVEFTWVPSQEVYEKLWSRCQELNPKYPSVEFQRAVFDLDILGIKTVAYDPPRVPAGDDDDDDE